MYSVSNLTRLALGRQGENGVTNIKIDVSDWLEKWPDGAFSIAHMPYGATMPYVPTNTYMDGPVLVWPVTSSDTAVPGLGRVEVRCTVGDVLKKSAVADGAVEKGIPNATGDVPTPLQDWVNRIDSTIKNVEQSLASGAFDGKGLTVLGYYETLDDLVEAVPNPERGDVYGIATDSGYDMYIWDAVNYRWVNNGALSVDLDRFAAIATSGSFRDLVDLDELADYIAGQLPGAAGVMF